MGTEHKYGVTLALIIFVCAYYGVFVVGGGGWLLVNNLVSELCKIVTCNLPLYLSQPET